MAKIVEVIDESFVGRYGASAVARFPVRSEVVGLSSIRGAEIAA